MLTVINPNVTSADNIQTLGREVYLYRKGAAGFTDLGVIESVAVARADTRRTLRGNRTGKTQVFKDVPDDDTLTFTVQTSAVGDANVRSWYVGTEGDVTTDADGDVVAYADTAGSLTGGMIFVRQTDSADGLCIVRAYPHVQVSGNGEPDIQNFDGLQFLITVLGASGFTPPAAFGDLGGAKPNGVIYQVPKARLDALLTALGTAIKAYVDAA